MPLEGVKSVVYRSFLTCDDPKGVVDCNIIKISKVSSQKVEQKIKVHRTSRNSNKEVCEEAEKLNLMVDSWSKGVRSDRKTEDLLEGTSRSLRESLIMLAKLQEASSASVRLKTKYRKGFSCHLEDESFPVEVQRSKLSSRNNGPDVVKKVIRDSLVRRDVTRNVAVGERCCFRDVNSNLGTEIPSTSSSQSSMIGDDNVKCCHVSTSDQKNLKRNNLIAKLMGLEEISSRSVQSTTPTKELEFGRVSGYKASLFGIDTTLNARKSKFVINKEDPVKGTLREILEKMPFNRLIESDSDKEFKLHCPHSNGSKQRLRDVPPIVLIKPKSLPHNKLEEHRARVFSKEEAFNQKAMLRRTNKKELRSFDDSNFRGGILSSDKLHREQKEEGIPLEPITQEGRTLKHKEKVGKLRKGIVDTKKKAAEKLKTSSPIHEMQLEKEPIDKKVLTSKKLTTTTRKPVEIEFAKEKVASTIARKNKARKQSSAISDSVSGRAARENRNCKKKEEAVLAHSYVDSLIQMVEAKKDDESTDTNESVNFPINRNTTTLMALISMENETDTDECDTKIIECCEEIPNSLSPLSPKLKSDTSIAEVIDPNSHTETNIESCDRRTNLKALLLRSSSFLYHAVELFDLNPNIRTMLQPASRCNNDPEASNTKHLIDCAVELVERRGHHDLQVANSLLQLLGHSRSKICVEKLVEEVCNDIDTLTSYQTIGGENLVVDTLYDVLNKDVWCKEVMNGMWDFGWKNGFSRSESEEIVNEVEKLILSGLIEESFK